MTDAHQVQSNVCQNCGHGNDFPYEWCVCGLSHEQKTELECLSEDMIMVGAISKAMRG
jgi:hypothetical protein